MYVFSLIVPKYITHFNKKKSISWIVINDPVKVLKHNRSDGGAGGPDHISGP